MILAQIRDLLTDTVLAAGVAAVPSTVAAIAAVKAAGRVRTNGSGKSLGLLVEDMHAQLNDHVANSAIHCHETEKHIENYEQDHQKTRFR